MALVANPQSATRRQFRGLIPRHTKRHAFKFIHYSVSVLSVYFVSYTLRMSNIKMARMQCLPQRASSPAGRAAWDTGDDRGVTIRA